jgi:hypothetical protein
MYKNYQEGCYTVIEIPVEIYNNIPCKFIIDEDVDYTKTLLANTLELRWVRSKLKLNITTDYILFKNIGSEKFNKLKMEAVEYRIKVLENCIPVLDRMISIMNRLNKTDLEEKYKLELELVNTDLLAIKNKQGKEC